MVEVTDGGRRPEEWDPAVLDEGLEDEHVVALVGVPGAAGGEVREPGDDGEYDDRARHEPEDRSRRDPGTDGGGSVGHVRAATGSGSDASGSGSTNRGVAARDRLPRSWNASGGSGSRASPRARATARETLIAS